MFKMNAILATVLSLGTYASFAPHYRTFYYIGGEYVPSPANASVHLHVGQTYVEHLTPLKSPKKPKPALIFLHGAAQLGTNFLTTPDGRPGWADYFLNAGYELYIPDQVYNGRSAPPVDSTRVAIDAEFIEHYFTATRKYSTEWPQAALHTQWPGNGSLGDPAFDAFYMANVPIEADGVLQQKRMTDAVVRLVREKVKKGREVVIVAHSQAGFWGWTAAEKLGKDVVKGIVSMEPPGPPFEDRLVQWGPPPIRCYGLADIPLKYSPPLPNDRALIDSAVRVGKETAKRNSCLLQPEPARQLVGLKNIPTLVVTAEASFHAPYDHCTVKYLKQAGVQVEYYELAEKGIRGNGHMFFIEKNSKKSAALVERWISKL